MNTDLELLETSVAAIIFDCLQNDKDNRTLPALRKLKTTITMMRDNENKDKFAQVDTTDYIKMPGSESMELRI